MGRKIVTFIFSIVVIFIILFLSLITPCVCIFMAMNSSEPLWISPTFWIAMLFFVVDMLVIYLDRHNIFVNIKVTPKGIVISRLWWYKKMVKWDDVKSGTIRNVGNKFSYYLVLVYGYLGKSVDLSKPITPLKQPCVGLHLYSEGIALENFIMIHKYLPEGVIEDSEDAREWMKLYNKVMRERAKKEARKAERKRLREYK